MLSRLELEHPTDAPSYRCNYGSLVSAGASLETVVFDRFDSKHIRYPIV